ncbi:DUF1499 domain-containing protein [Pelagibacterium montanilacus]|uniref:DUF1499 domain-containing protein n=1 Tax=Pelagibacterium montanilacus TaxID=2185280 RepID=UPI000F8F6943|nr:DUF1499 domain-containing protein [Pelagibacterium montanilacus]
MRIPIRTSRLAKWSRRLASFAFPVLVLATILHLLGGIDTDAYEICLIITSALALAAVLLAIAAYIRLWYTGDRGWGAASVGLFAGAIALAPAGYSAAMVAIYPSTADITTNVLNPPELVLATGHERDIFADTDDMIEHFPDLLSRTYQIPPESLYEMALGEGARRGWDVAREVSPGEEQPGQINFERRTALGWPNEVAIRVGPSDLGSRMDLRAASIRSLLHDLGDNGRTLEAFLVGLDETATTYLQENVYIEEEEEAPAEVVVD